LLRVDGIFECIRDPQPEQVLKVGFLLRAGLRLRAGAFFAVRFVVLALVFLLAGDFRAVFFLAGLPALFLTAIT